VDASECQRDKENKEKYEKYLASRDSRDIWGGCQGAVARIGIAAVTGCPDWRI